MSQGRGPANMWRANTGFLPIWEECRGSIVQLEGLGLSLVKQPPAMVYPPPAPPPPKPAPPPVAKADTPFMKGVTWMLSAGSSATVATAPPSPSPPLPPPPPPPPPPIKPFDIQDIPKTMRKLHMPMSAAMMERWFQGQLNYSRTREDEKDQLDQNGNPYPPSMTDESIIKLEWVLGYRRAKSAYDRLTEQAFVQEVGWSKQQVLDPYIEDKSPLRNSKAKHRLAKILGPYKNRLTSFSAWQICGRDIENLHKQFQFQLSGVDGGVAQKIAAQLRAENESNGLPDDLTGALGAFNIYAAVAEFHIEYPTAVITSIAVYVKDNYTFVTNKGEPSQYLGHWNKESVVIKADAALATSLYEINQLVVRSDSHPPRVTESNTYFPVRNRSFRDWQVKHQQGGDFVVYSNIHWVRLKKFIRVNL